MKKYAEVPNPFPTGYAVYAMPTIKLGVDEFVGWVAKKQKIIETKDDNGEIGKSLVDDETQPYLYDEQTQLLQANVNQKKDLADVVNLLVNSNAITNEQASKF